MEIKAQDTTVGVRQPTVSKNTSLGREFFRTATWEDAGTTVKVEAIAFVSGVRARKNPDGSVDLLAQVTRFDVLGKDEFVQPVELAVFLWEREQPGAVRQTAVDHSTELGLYYQPDVAGAEEQCRIFMENLEFEAFDPTAW